MITHTLKLATSIIQTTNILQLAGSNNLQVVGSNNLQLVGSNNLQLVV